MNPSEIQSYLDTFLNYEAHLHQCRVQDFSLDRVVRLLALAGNPEQGLKIVHVAGTKGKGSTCAFLATILQQAGYRVGLYTSPHLHRVNERIRILDQSNQLSKEGMAGAICDEDLAGVLEELKFHCESLAQEGVGITFFEIITVAALSYFAKRDVDLVILEAGLGGRLDATNAVDACVAVITPIGLDHTLILGDTLAKIASEKAGIVKNSWQRVAIAPQDPEVMAVLRARCQCVGVVPVNVTTEFLENLEIGLKGPHQRVNAALAVAVVEILRTLGFSITDTAVREGIRDVRWPGRFELLRKNPDIVVDCAHNEASALALAKTLEQEYPQRRILLILGVSQDKDFIGILRAIQKNAAHFVFTQARHPRARVFSKQDLSSLLDGVSFEIQDSLSQALSCAMARAKENDVIVITGSVFIVAEMMRYVSI